MKKQLRLLLIFVSVLSLTIVAGSFGLLFYSEYINRHPDTHDGAVASDTTTAADTGFADANENVNENANASSFNVIANDNSDAAAGDADMSYDANVSDDADTGISDAGKSNGDSGIYSDNSTDNDNPDTDEADASGDDSENGNTSDAGDISASSHVTLVFTGDICFHDPYANMGAFRQRGSSIDNCIDSVLLSKMREADICLVNNEFPYSDRGAPLPGKTYAFRSRPENVDILKSMGVDIAGLANNHAYDHGQDAFLDTLDVLSDAGIPYIGAGHDISEASAPLILEKSGMKIGFLAATQIERNWSPDTRGATDSSPGVMRCFTDEELARFLSAIKSADEMCDLLVVFVHWGSENTDVLDFRQTDQAAAFADAGADLIVGAHPHCLQGLGRCGDVPVVYSLGNYWFNSKRVDTALLEVIADKDGIRSLQMVAARQHDCRTDHLEGSDKQQVLGYLNSISKDGVYLDEEGYLVMP